MRIGIYIPVLEHSPTGLGVFILEVVTRLIEKHPDCVIFTQDAGNVPAWLAGMPLVECRSILASHGKQSGFLSRLGRLLWLNSASRSDFKKLNVDVFFSPIQEGGIFAFVPQVSVVHDLTPIRFPEAYSKYHVLFTKLYLPWVLRHSVKVIAVSQSTKSDVEKFFSLPPSLTSVVYEGFDRALFCPPRTDDVDELKRVYSLPDQYFFYSGTFSRHKNLVTALRAFARVKKKFPSIEFVLTGRRDSGDFKLFFDVATNLGVQNSIKMLGYVPREDLHVLIGNSVAYVFPSLFEGFGLAPLEALACGATVISSNAGSLPEVIGDGGYLLPPLDVDAWAETMTQVVAQNDNPEFRAHWRDKAIAQASLFSWDAAVNQILGVLAMASEHKFTRIA